MSDWRIVMLVVAAYLAANLYVGLRAGRKSSDTDDVSVDTRDGHQFDGCARKKQFVRRGKFVFKNRPFAAGDATIATDVYRNCPGDTW